MMDFLTTADSGTSCLPWAIARLVQKKTNERHKSFFEMHVIGFLPLDGLSCQNSSPFGVECHLGKLLVFFRFSIWG